MGKIVRTRDRWAAVVVIVVLALSASLNTAMFVGAGIDGGASEDWEGWEMENQTFDRELEGEESPTESLSGDPIKDWHDLNAIRYNPGEDYYLANDLHSGTPGYDDHASESANGGEGWEPIGESSPPIVSGTLDGNGHEIRDFYIDRSGNNIGIFGYIGSAEITNVGVVNAEVSGDSAVGALVGNIGGSAGIVKNSYATGCTVTGDFRRIGGLVGYNHRGTVSGSYASGVEVGSGSENKVGGLVGHTNGDVENSYATGHVSGDSDVGGLVGYMDSYSDILHSYSTCSVSGSSDEGGLVGGEDDLGNDYVDSYWNTETSGQSSSVGGEGRTTDEMTHPHLEGDDTFYDYDEDVWNLRDSGLVEDQDGNSGYPALGWQSGQPDWVFTTAGQDGYEGPSQGDVDTEYSGTSLEGEVEVIGEGIQRWEVPATGRYSIGAYGSAAGEDSADDATGFGAYLRAEYHLEEYETLRILVGQMSTDGSYMGGGGGTFVVKEDPGGEMMFDGVRVEPLVIAGGGGGGRTGYTECDREAYSDAWTDEDGRDAPLNGVTNEGGSGGSGGETASGGDGNDGGGGGGYIGDGEDGRDPGGQNFLDGGLGGQGSDDGGFGGGGGSGWGGGGGGGYSGGGAGSRDGDGCGGARNAAGGGSYYNSELGELIDSEDGANYKDGLVEIGFEEEVDWSFYATSTGRDGEIHTWTVPEDGTYRINTRGAVGGEADNTKRRGYGAVMEAEFELEEGDKLKILVGQQGHDYHSSDGNAGGGGTFVVKEVGSSDYKMQDGPYVEPLIVAGGGGGSWDTTNPPDYWDARTWHDGTSGGVDSGDGGRDEGAGGGFTGTGEGDGAVEGTSGGSFLYGYQGEGEDDVGGCGNPGIGGESNRADSPDGDGGFGGGGAYGSFNYGSGGGGFDGGDFTPYGHENDPHDPSDYQPGGGSFLADGAQDAATSDGYWASENYDGDAYSGSVENLGEWNTEGHGLVTIDKVSDWSFYATSTGRDGDIQTWTVPVDGVYRMTAYGAQGGTGSRVGKGGRGARISGEFELEAGTTIEILVGQKGNIDGNSEGPSGGGGSFVVREGAEDEDDILVIAGGGGGYGVGDTTNYQERAHGHTETWGKDGYGEGNVDSDGGTGGDGGGDTADRGASGGGFYTDGGDGSYSGSGGRAYLNGGLGGDGGGVCDGGFGAGGATDRSTGWGAAGGGGGYSGGGGAYSGSNSEEAAGGGGGSYNNGVNQEEESGVREGHGLVRIDTVMPFTFTATSTGRAGTIQTATVPEDGTYRIRAEGAVGGDGGSDSRRGYGAVMEAEFELQKGDELKVLVGQKGHDYHSNDGNAGGGGTFVVKEVEGSDYKMQDGPYVAPLIVAGGGGGSWDNNPPDNWDARTWHDGTSGGIDSGDGGSGEGAGGGFTGTGEEDSGTYDTGGGSFLHGYQGAGNDDVQGCGNHGIGGEGDDHPDGYGGFGGGGGYGSYNYGSGGGGFDGGDFTPYGHNNDPHDPSDYQPGGGSFLADGAQNAATSDGYWASENYGGDAYSGSVEDLDEWNTAGHGLVIVEKIREIEDWHDLDDVRNYLAGEYILMNDLDDTTDGYSDYNTGSGWNPIGDSNNPFTGILYGQGYEIKDLYIDRTSETSVGLFGTTDDDAEITNVGLVDVDVTSQGRAAGLVAYHDDGVISDCYVTGEVSGGAAAGGLAAEARTADIETSYSTADVDGDEWVGGLVGILLAYGDYGIYNSYATGNVNGNSDVGGLVGRISRAIVEDSYSTGHVSGGSFVGGLIGYDSSGPFDPEVTNSYWNTETSAQTGSTEGEGRTTDEMTWGYAGDTYDGWDMSETPGEATWLEGDHVTVVDHEGNSGYPALGWQEFVEGETLTVLEPAGDGTVSVDGDEITGYEYTETFVYGTEVDLLADPDEGWYFDVWTGDTGAIDESSSADTFITMYDDYTITANFDAIEIWTDYDQISGTGLPGQEVEMTDNTVNYRAKVGIDIVVYPDGSFGEIGVENLHVRGGDVSSYESFEGPDDSITLKSNENPGGQVSFFVDWMVYIPYGTSAGAYSVTVVYEIGESGTLLSPSSTSYEREIDEGSTVARQLSFTSGDARSVLVSEDEKDVESVLEDELGIATLDRLVYLFVLVAVLAVVTKKIMEKRGSRGSRSDRDRYG